MCPPGHAGSLDHYFGGDYINENFYSFAITDSTCWQFLLDKYKNNFAYYDLKSIFVHIHEAHLVIIVRNCAPRRNHKKWRHYEHDGVSNHRHLESLFNRLCGRRSNKTSKLRVAGLCEGNPPVTGGFPSQSASNAEKVPFADVIMIVFCHQRAQRLITKTGFVAMNHLANIFPQ